MDNNHLDNFITYGLKRRSTVTRETYKAALLHFELFLRTRKLVLDNFTKQDVQDYLDAMEGEGKAPATIHKHFYALRAYSKWIKRKTLTEDIRLIHLPDVKKIKPETLSKEERQALVAMASENKRNVAIILLFLGAGLSVSELVTLNRCDVRLENNRGTIIIHKRNAEKTREVAIGPMIRQALSDYLFEREDDHSALFISNRDRPISTRSVQMIIKKYGGDKLRATVLRHTFISAMVQGEEDWSVIQKQAGLITPQMLPRYAKPTKVQIQEVADRLFDEE
ncbi:tyrosine-type recombinase/integrase [Heliorestis convoluta]|uniref:Tyrosine-type recombinase/integrase n=1 Tax=Heliorestis convoluta TaxID=356322 RepID=A0A5Q2MY02_9FIRM|nr:tyrosine-type recombinase/integrase [Heliorestis convoluta]QGG46771.1 tyrosine-type recombinase/integrase [Heliorestis convoluta]